LKRPTAYILTDTIIRHEAARQTTEYEEHKKREGEEKK
jgi:hypothetical protein